MDLLLIKDFLIISHIAIPNNVPIQYYTIYLKIKSSSYSIIIKPILLEFELYYILYYSIQQYSILHSMV